MSETAYLPGERLLAKHPGRLANINAALAACYMKIGEPVPESLLPADGGRGSDYIVNDKQED